MARMYRTGIFLRCFPTRRCCGSARLNWRRFCTSCAQVVHKGTGEKYALKCMEMRRIDPELLDDLRYGQLALPHDRVCVML